MADDALTFLPLFPNDDEDAILARLIASANEGLDPAVDVNEWVDTREPGHWRTCVMPCVREFARLYDLAGTEVPMAAFPVWAWMDYLDDHAETQDIVRLAATPADGSATFSGPAATVIAAGTTVGVEPVNPDDEVAEFEVLVGGTIPAAAAAPAGPSATGSTGGGTLAASADYAYRISATDDAGETLPGTEVVGVVPGGGPGKITLGWTAVAGAAAYRIYRADAAGGTYGRLVEVSGTTSYIDTGAVAPNLALGLPVANTTGGKKVLTIRATEAGVAGNVAAGAITVFSTPPPPGVTVTNPVATTGGTEAETDEALRERVLGAFQGQGAGNKRDYERWGRAWTGVGRVTVIPLWDGPGTVKLIATTADGDPVSAATVTGLQADLDPVAGMAEGRAPVGAVVTVTTATTRSIEITATVEFEPGYSLDGFGGTVARAAEITAALRSYVEAVPAGGEIVVAHLVGQVAGVAGVHDVHIDALEGVTPAVNVTISANPAQVPVLSVPTLIEGAL
jgi:uncharacterized phage protein gp47/JayE